MAVAQVHHPFDASSPNLPLDELTAAGYTDAIRYATGAGKAITRAEWVSFAAWGSITLVNESFAQAAFKTGRAGGVSEASAANAAADAVGMPRGPAGAIYYVGDDPQPASQWMYPSIVEYFRGVATVHDVTGRRIGAYGSGAQINNTRAQVPQVTLEWAVRTWGLSGHPNLIQEANPTMSTLNHRVDQNTAVTDDWGQFPFSQAGTIASGGTDVPTDRMEVVDVWVVPNTGGAHYFELHSDGGLFSMPTVGGPDPNALVWVAVSNQTGAHYNFPDPRFPGVFSYPGLVNTGHEVDTWPVRHFKRMVVLSYAAPQVAAVSRARRPPPRRGPR
ncbi:MAG TPA: glycoside hydrolase domain-containing protein [Acidimicrobiales bacterium]